MSHMKAERRERIVKSPRITHSLPHNFSMEENVTLAPTLWCAVEEAWFVTHWSEGSGDKRKKGRKMVARRDG